MKVIFVDRDGVINKDPEGWTEHSYVTKWEDFRFLPGVFDAFKKLAENGFEVMILTNQSGVGKGYYTKEKLDEINFRMTKEIEAGGGKIHAVHACIHKTEDNCECKKPKAGLFKMATEGLDVDFKKTFFVGDTKRDIEAGKAVGCKTILVLSGKTKDPQAPEGWPCKPDYVKKDLLEAVEVVCAR